MKFPLSWLKEFVDLSCSNEELSARLTDLGLEVESCQAKPLPFSGIVVGEIKACAQHPNAEKLKVTTVTTGSEEFQVVCGAPNCRAGLRVAFAPIGAQVVDEKGSPFKIKKGSLRGVDSCGMICSEDELGIGNDTAGIIELSERFKVGESFATYYSDTLFELKLTPNLAHCFSLLGIAREASASLKRPLFERRRPIRLGSFETAQRVEIQDADLSPRYACLRLSGVKVGPSPAWLQERLSACGVRSVNNVVDATNAIMLELGQPLHAFDAAKIHGTIAVRKAKEGEKLLTLDGKELTLSPSMVVIADERGPLALAGVMGGQASEVSETTVDILLEAAHFAPSAVRRSSRASGIKSESSKRFERGVDPTLPLLALDECAALITELAGGERAKSVVDQRLKSFESKAITFRPAKANALLGTELSLNEFESLLVRLGFSIRTLKEDQIEVKAPPYRFDIAYEVDLIEEVGRLFGFNNIEERQIRYSSSTTTHSPLFLFEREVRSRLIAQGLQEFFTSNLVSPEEAALFDERSVTKADLIEIQNPSTRNYSVLRPSLLPTLLGAVLSNQHQRIDNVAAFELGSIHFREGDKLCEEPMVGIVMKGEIGATHWSEPSRACDFFDLKGVVVNLLAGLGIDGLHFSRSDYSTLHPGQQAALYKGSQQIGLLGQVHPKVADSCGLRGAIFYAHLTSRALMEMLKREPKAKALPQFPSSERDWTLTVKSDLPAATVESAVRAVPSGLLKELSLIALYRSDELGAEWKNLTFHFVYRDDRKTLSVESVEKEHQRITSNVTKVLGDALK